MIEPTILHLCFATWFKSFYRVTNHLYKNGILSLCLFIFCITLYFTSEREPYQDKCHTYSYALHYILCCYQAEYIICGEVTIYSMYYECPQFSDLWLSTNSTKHFIYFPFLWPHPVPSVDWIQNQFIPAEKDVQIEVGLKLPVMWTCWCWSSSIDLFPCGEFDCLFIITTSPPVT